MNNSRGLTIFVAMVWGITIAMMTNSVVSAQNSEDVSCGDFYCLSAAENDQAEREESLYNATSSPTKGYDIQALVALATEEILYEATRPRIGVVAGVSCPAATNESGDVPDFPELLCDWNADARLCFEQYFSSMNEFWKQHGPQLPTMDTMKEMKWIPVHEAAAEVERDSAASLRRMQNFLTHETICDRQRADYVLDALDGVRRILMVDLLADFVSMAMEGNNLVSALRLAEHIADRSVRNQLTRDIVIMQATLGDFNSSLRAIRSLDESSDRIVALTTISVEMAKRNELVRALAVIESAHSECRDESCDIQERKELQEGFIEIVMDRADAGDKRGVNDTILKAEALLGDEDGWLDRMRKAVALTHARASRFWDAVNMTLAIEDAKLRLEVAKEVEALLLERQ